MVSATSLPYRPLVIWQRPPRIIMDNHKASATSHIARICKHLHAPDGFTLGQALCAVGDVSPGLILGFTSSWTTLRNEGKIRLICGEPARYTYAGK